MQEYSYQIQPINIAGHSFSLFVPDDHAIRQEYERQRSTHPELPAPYWAKLWPAGLGLARFIMANAHYVVGKQVLELAAGLGLPSIAAATYARAVVCTDLFPEAVSFANRSAKANGLSNFFTKTLDWNNLDSEQSFDVLLLSDVNYDPADFELLYAVLVQQLHTGATVILSTPQRLMAKPFIARLLLWCVQQELVTVPSGNTTAGISIYVLKATGSV